MEPHNQAVEPFPLLALTDLVLQQILSHLTTRERKATRAACKKLCKVASAAVKYFHVGSAREESYLEYLDLHKKFPNVQVVSLADELVASDRPFASLVTLSLCRLKNLCCVLLLNKSLALSAAGMAALAQCRNIKQLVLAPPFVSKGPLMTANTQAMTSIISQLPSLTHLLLLPSQHPDPVATAVAAAVAAAAHAGGGGLAGAAAQQQVRLREWQLNQAAFRQLDCLHSLVQLEVGCDPAGLTDLSSLAGLSNLRHVALRGLGLEAGDQLGVLQALPALSSLSLADGGISEDSLSHVGRCTRLTRLELQGCYRIREQGLSHLSSLHRLSHFTCSLTLTEAGLSMLVAAAGTRLQLLQADSLEVTHADIHGAQQQQQQQPVVAAAMAAAAHAANHAAHVQAYVPLGGPLGAAMAAAAHAAGVGGGLGQQQQLAAAGGSGSSGSGGGFGQLGPQLPALQVLLLRRLSSSSSPQLWQLAPHLQSLVVWGESSNAGLTRAFSGHCSLQRLALNLEATTDAGLGAVSCLSQLQDLTLCDGRAISAQRLIGVLRRLPKLKALQLSRVRNLNDEGLAALVTSAPQLKCLGLQEPGRVTEQGFALLAGLQNLATLWVDCCKLSVPVLVALACSSNLSHLQVHRSHPEAPGLGQHQLQLLARVRGPQLGVVLREGARPRDEIMRHQGGLWGVGGSNGSGGYGGGSSVGALLSTLGSSSGSSGVVGEGWGSVSGVLAGGSSDVVLDAAELRLLGSGVLLGQLAGDASSMDGIGDGAGLDGGAAAEDWMAMPQDWLPDVGGLHL